MEVFLAGYADVLPTYVITVCWVLSILLNAKSDASIDNTAKRNHLLELGSELFLLLGAGLIWVFYMQGWNFSIWVFLKYPLLRLGMFNLVYNQNRQPSLSWDYVGNTDWFDRQLYRFRQWGISSRIPWLFILYFFSFAIGLFIY